MASEKTRSSKEIVKKPQFIARSGKNCDHTAIWEERYEKNQMTSELVQELKKHSQFCSFCKSLYLENSSENEINKINDTENAQNASKNKDIQSKINLDKELEPKKIQDYVKPVLIAASLLIIAFSAAILSTFFGLALNQYEIKLTANFGKDNSHQGKIGMSGKPAKKIQITGIWSTQGLLFKWEGDVNITKYRIELRKTGSEEPIILSCAFKNQRFCISNAPEFLLTTKDISGLDFDKVNTLVIKPGEKNQDDAFNIKLPDKKNQLKMPLWVKIYQIFSKLVD
jgi:hypothetical protein